MIDAAYRVRAVIGSGGMGTVYQAHDETLGREVAIKLIHEDLLASVDVRDGFLVEARSMARVRHENVVTIHAFGTHCEQPYLVMEYVDGPNLAAWLAENGKPELDEAIAMIDALCRGVEAIHAAGATHRDVKPANVLVGARRRVAVTDFGLATPTGGLERADAGAHGTPSYMAPELARGEPIHARSAVALDIYGLGLVAFELLTGKRPFAAKSSAAILQDHAFRAPPPPSEVCAGLPSAFDAPILAALAKTPDARTTSAEALRMQLQRAHADLAEYPEGLKIVVVDDDTSTLSAVCELLRMTFPAANVISVSNTQSAMDVTRRERPDVVLTDLDMPGGGGSMLTAALRADPRTEDIPIIVITGRGGAADWAELRELGADRFLLKPIDFDALSAMIRRLVPTSR
jgi:serine/threonine protein kinase